VAGLNEILYTYLIEVGASTIQAYVEMLERIAHTQLPFFENVNLNHDPSFSSDVYGHATDLNTLQLWHKLAKRIQEFRKTSEESHFPAHDLIPYVVSYWNHTKRGTRYCISNSKKYKGGLFCVITKRIYIYSIHQDGIYECVSCNQSHAN
jgi:hypothetical protein